MARYEHHQILKLYAQIFDRRCPPIISEEILRDLDQGTPAMYYTYALRETINAPRPSWAYTKAILRRLKINQVPVNRLYDPEF